MKKFILGLVALMAIAFMPSVVSADDAPPITDEIVLTDNYVTADLEMELVPSVVPMEFEIYSDVVVFHSLEVLPSIEVFAERHPLLKIKFLDQNKHTLKSYPNYRKRLMYFQLE
jgi:hypothetical protein